MSAILDVVVISIDVGNSITVRGDPVSFVSKVPSITKKCLEEVRAGTGWHAVDLDEKVSNDRMDKVKDLLLTAL